MSIQRDIMTRRYANDSRLTETKPTIPESMQQELDHPEREPHPYKRRILEALHYHQTEARTTRVHPSIITNWYLLCRTLNSAETENDLSLLQTKLVQDCLDGLEKEMQARTPVRA